MATKTNSILDLPPAVQIFAIATMVLVMWFVPWRKMMGGPEELFFDVMWWILRKLGASIRWGWRKLVRNG